MWKIPYKTWLKTHASLHTSHVVYVYACRYAMSSVRSSSSLTKWAARISGELVNLVSPNFTRTFIPTYSSATQDRASLTSSSQKLSWKTVENAVFGWNFSITFKARIMKFYALIGTICLTYLLDMTSLTASGQLQNALRYCTKVWLAKELNNSATV